MNMRVPGIDPITMNRVQERTQKQIVQETQQSKISEKEHQGRERRQPRDRQELEKAVRKLNRAVAAMEKPLQFNLVEKQGKLMIQIIDTFRKRLLKEVQPEKVFAIALRAEEILGILVDELI